MEANRHTGKIISIDVALTEIDNWVTVKATVEFELITSSSFSIADGKGTVNEIVKEAEERAIQQAILTAQTNAPEVGRLARFKEEETAIKIEMGRGDIVGATLNG